MNAMLFAPWNGEPTPWMATLRESTSEGGAHYSIQGCEARGAARGRLSVISPPGRGADDRPRKPCATVNRLAHGQR